MRHTSLWLAALVLLSRIPFLFDGYGSEEDAWALALVAERIALTGTYEVSRLPGHPLQELVYAFVHSGGPLLFNLLTAIISTVGVVAFYHVVRRVNPTIALWSAIALASTPVVFIHSTNAMDYTWAMSFLLLAFLSLLHNRMLLCGLCIGLATGCRITSAAMVLPFALYVYQTLPAQQKIKSITGLIGYTYIFSLLVFLPVIQHYGLGFFTYYEHFPIPHWTKNLYKGSLGVWGLPALLLMGWFFFTSLKNIRARYTGLEYRQQALVMLCLLSVILIGIAFIRLPLKSAFLIPAVPFFLILFGFLVSRKQFRTLSLALLLGCFMLGVNLAEAHRGSDTSKLAVRFQIANHQIAFDPLIGLVTADRSKRLQRTAYAQQVIRTCSTIEQRSAILCGWWLADILVLAANEKNNPAITYLHYISPQQADSLSQSGYTIYFLEEQEYYNDLRFDSVFTKSVCLPISIQD